MNRPYLSDDLLDAAREQPEPSGTVSEAPDASFAASASEAVAAVPATLEPTSPAAELPDPLGLERDQMAWPPAGWEGVDPAWRTDLSYTSDPGSGPGHGLFNEAAVGMEAVAQPWPGLDSGEAHVGTNPRRMLREVLETVFLALLIFLGIRVFVLQFKIEGTSMSPTMADGEYILVNRLAYRLFGQPRRGDIIVFESWSPGKDYIKRVIGLPGQRVEVRNMEVYIDGERLDEAYLPATSTTGERTEVLGPNEYFVMGDNRDNSQDSRALGALAGDKIIGKALLIYWPPRAIGMVPDADQVRPIITDPANG